MVGAVVATQSPSRGFPPPAEAGNVERLGAGRLRPVGIIVAICGHGHDYHDLQCIHVNGAIEWSSGMTAQVWQGQLWMMNSPLGQRAKIAG